MSDPVEFTEEQRQAILLALAELALSRPGWDYMLGEIAAELKGVEMFQEFKRLNADRVKYSHGPLGPEQERPPA